MTDQAVDVKEVDEVRQDDATEEDQDPEEPKKWKVIFLNDEYTPMTFVTTVLREIFRKGEGESFSLMMDVHNNGSSVVGVYPKGIAETKKEETISRAREEGHPLNVRIEPEDDEDQ